jgi:molecular chaperone GrpE
MSDEKKKKTDEQEQTQGSREQMEKLQQELEDARKEKDEVFARLQRVSADYANFQKRVPRQVSDSVAYEREKILRSLLPVLDNFERTLLAETSDQNLEAFVKGVEIIRDQMLGVLKSHGVEPIQAVGEKFDPEWHEAMMRKHEADQPDEVVLEEYQKGYRLDERILRPSRVAVNKIQQAASGPGTEAPEDASEQQENAE